MGRKSQSKHSSKKNTAKENNRYIQNRKELNVLVDKVLRLTSFFQNLSNPNKSWEHHLEIETVLRQIINIETVYNSKSKPIPRQAGIQNYLKWLCENGAQYDGIQISEFEGYELGLKANKDFKEGSLILTVPAKVMITEKNAQDSDLSEFIQVDPLLQNMPNITLALFLLLEKCNPDSFWKPYVDILPEKYSTILYFTSDEIALLKPSPVFESTLKLYRSIARQYAYFYNKIHSLDIPVLKKLQNIFTFDNYRWAVSTVMTRQNNVQLADGNIAAFIPLWDMCNHEQGKITTDFNKDENVGECYALRDFKAGEQIFIFYGVRPNADLFLHNGFVYPNNEHDSLSLILGLSSADPLRELRLSLLTKLGLGGVTHFSLYKGDNPISAEMLAFVRIFTMKEDELKKCSEESMPSDLLDSAANMALVNEDSERRAYTYLITRCSLVRAMYKTGAAPHNLHSKNVKLLKQCEVDLLEGAIEYLNKQLQNINQPTKVNM
ncbi:hypothetical protein ACJJTC_006338 [Scirpophaga incertulas]